MKKNAKNVIITFSVAVIAALFVLQMTSCQKPHQHTVKTWTTETEATCSKEGTEVGVCVECGEKVTRSIPKTEHKISSSWTVKDEPTVSSYGHKVKKCVNCGEELETELIDKLCWELSYWQDDFGDYTSDAVAFTTISGRFSNSATTNSALTVHVYADRNYKGYYSSSSCIKMKMWEYDSYLTTYLSSWSYKLKVKKPNGDSVEYGLSAKGDYLSLPNDLISFLQNGQDLDCTIVEINYSGNVSSTWEFTIKSSGFSEAYKQS